MHAWSLTITDSDYQSLTVTDSHWQSLSEKAQVQLQILPTDSDYQHWQWLSVILTDSRQSLTVGWQSLSVNHFSCPWRAFSVNQFCRIFLQIFVEFKKCRIYKSYSNCKHWNCQNKNLRKQRFLAFHRLLLFLTVLSQLFFLNKPSS